MPRRKQDVLEIIVLLEREIVSSFGDLRDAQRLHNEYIRDNNKLMNLQHFLDLSPLIDAFHIGSNDGDGDNCSATAIMKQPNQSICTELFRSLRHSYLRFILCLLISFSFHSMLRRHSSLLIFHINIIT